MAQDASKMLPRWPQDDPEDTLENPSKKGLPDYPVNPTVTGAFASGNGEKWEWKGGPPTLYVRVNDTSAKALWDPKS